MKSFLSPAISVMKQFNYRKKFFFLGLISLMVIGVLIYSLFISLNRVVHNSEQQLIGLELMTPLSKAIQNLQQHRGWSAGLLAGKHAMLANRASKEVEVSRSIEQIEKNLPNHLTTNTNWIKIKNNWNNILVKGLDWSVTKNFSVHTYLIEQLQFFKILIADEYALTFTSEIDSYYLIDTSINKLPEAMEQLGQIHAFGTSILAKKKASEYQRIEMMTLIAKLELSIKPLLISLNKTAHFNKIINSQLSKASKDIVESVEHIIDLVWTDILGEQFITLPENFFTQVTTAIDKSYATMYQTLLPTTKSLITTRLQKAKNTLYISIAISMLLMMIVLYFVLGIYYSMMGSVQSLSKSLKQFANGDLHERIHLDTQDELKYIGHSFNQLAEKITYLLASAENSQKKIQQVLDGLLTMAGILLPDGTLDFANSRPLELSGLKQEDVLGKKLWDCPWFSYDSVAREQIRSDCQLAAQGEEVNREIEFALLDHKIWVDFSVHPVFDEQKKVLFLVAEARDATRRRLAEEHSKRSQKMNALGKLVGGIAHDYNNMLGVILGYAELLEMKCTHTEGTENYINEIIRAGERGRSLTRKMLAFSKSESSNPAMCNVNQVLLDIKDMLAKSLTASINLDYDLNQQTWSVWLDINELEDAILNMSINAKYAIPDSGTLTISTQNIYLPREQARLLGLTANDYLRLTLSDTGCGMDEEIKNHVFDPFFTTKGDAGNGLGLSQVFGFVERSGGAISLLTEINKGSQFTLYFPRYHADHHIKKIFDSSSAPQLAGNESILVVDDEPALRELANQILTHFGYYVLTASSGEAALNLLVGNTVDLVLSDVIMPDMDGYQLAEQVSKLYPLIKIQLASGFSDNRHTESDLQLKQNILNKPYSSKELLTSIRLLLD